MLTGGSVNIKKVERNVITKQLNQLCLGLIQKVIQIKLAGFQNQSSV